MRPSQAVHSRCQRKHSEILLVCAFRLSKMNVGARNRHWNARRFIEPHPRLPVSAWIVPRHPHNEFIWRYPRLSKIATTTSSARSPPRTYLGVLVSLKKM